MQTRILVPTGVLGMGFDQAALEAGIKRAPDAICVDGGSTDTGLLAGQHQPAPVGL